VTPLDHAGEAALGLEVPEEPAALRRALREQQLGVSGRDGERDYDARMAEWLWERWQGPLEGRGMGEEAFAAVVAGYRREVWYWLLGERRWEPCVDGLLGRVARRLPARGAG
jgi:hypothetical protein